MSRDERARGLLSSGAGIWRETGDGAGCFWLFLAARELIQSRVRVVHLIELVREAVGERVVFPRGDRAWDILTVIAYQLGQGMKRVLR